MSIVKKPSPKLDNGAIGSRIKDRRIEKNISQKDFADMVGYGLDQVKSLERGDSGMSLQKAVAVADNLGESLDYLVLGKSANPIGSKEIMDTLDQLSALIHQHTDLVCKRAELVQAIHDTDTQIEKVVKEEEYRIAQLKFKLRA